LDFFRPRSEIKTRVAAAEEAWQNALDNWIAQRDDWNLHRDQLLQQKHGQSRKSAKDKHLKARWLFYKNLHSAPRAHHESNLHLERFRIHPGDIPGIGPTAIQQLNEAGIATAFDLFPDLLRTVKGIGPERRRALMNWRKTCSLNVPVQGPDPTHYISIRNRHIDSLLKSTK
jgi:DNA-binding helix-hairpin-helix protein with protein kinase domain